MKRKKGRKRKKNGQTGKWWVGLGSGGDLLTKLVAACCFHREPCLLFYTYILCVCGQLLYFPGSWLPKTFILLYYSVAIKTGNSSGVSYLKWPVPVTCDFRHDSCICSIASNNLHRRRGYEQAITHVQPAYLSRRRFVKWGGRKTKQPAGAGVHSIACINMTSDLIHCARLAAILSKVAIIQHTTNVPAPYLCQPAYSVITFSLYLYHLSILCEKKNGGMAGGLKNWWKSADMKRKTLCCRGDPICGYFLWHGVALVRFPSHAGKKHVLRDVGKKNT